jgi:peptide chain release factor 2
MVANNPRVKNPPRHFGKEQLNKCSKNLEIAWKACPAGLRCSGGLFDILAKEQRLAEINKEIEKPGFWDNQKRASQTQKERADLLQAIGAFRQVEKRVREALELIDLAVSEGDESVEAELVKEEGSITQLVRTLELARMLSGPNDQASAFVNINAGAGGTESCDWAEMLMRMYLRYGESHGYATSIVDYQPGDEAGVRSCTIAIEGPAAYGYLRAEVGIHRLVRISPFDSNKRRHTSFASVFVYPQVEDSIDIEINEEDLRIDTYRAGGKGGQHVNKTDSAVRITHNPSGVVVQCQNERSQHRNKATAMKMLRSRLYEIEMDKRRAEQDAQYAQKKEIAWGSQIRSYVLQPYRMIKDHRTNHEVGNVERVLDGDLDEFIEAYLIQVGAEKQT